MARVSAERIVNGVLDVRHNVFGDEALEGVVDHLLARPNDVYRVDVGCNCLGDATGVKLAQLVVASTSLQELCMDNNWFSQKTVVALCVALAENTTLELLDVSGNQPCDRDVIESVLSEVRDSRATIRYTISE